MITTAGLFDLQVNGFAGIDFNDAALTPEAFEKAIDGLLASGVTQFLPTLITATEDQLVARFAALDRAVSASPRARIMVPGYHLEGPFLNPAPGFCGCHPASAMIGADIGLVDRLRAPLSKPIVLLTLAPEQPGSLVVIAEAKARGIAVALGHSDARAATIKQAISHGASLATHLGNGVAHQMHKFDNPIMAQLTEDSLWGCFITDGIHVPKDALKVLLRAKGLARSIMVTDAVSAAGAATGRYPFAGMWVDRTEDGTVREKDAPHLAGSSLTMDQGVRNLVQWGLCSFEEAIALASSHPRKALAEIGLTLTDPGAVTWSAQHQVIETRLKGEVVSRRAV